MVKNTVGGSKTKGFARKSFNKSSTSSIRLPQNELETFAIVTKMFGGGLCQVITNQHEITLNCVIRNKFKARFKNMNLVSLHSIILVGFREWESVDNRKICDLLEVYSNDDIVHLRSLPLFSHFTFDHILHTQLHETHLHDIIFSNTTHTTLHIEHTPHTTLHEVSDTYDIYDN